MTNVNEVNDFFGLIMHILIHKIKCMRGIISKFIQLLAFLGI